MTDILALLQPIQNSVSKTTLRQMSRIIVAIIAMTGRVTMLGISRWSEKGGSYRSIQRFYATVICQDRNKKSLNHRFKMSTFHQAKSPVRFFNIG